MNGWLRDSNVVSELRKNRPDNPVKAGADAQAADGLFLSSVTLAGIRYGIERQQTPSFATSLHGGSTTGYGRGLPGVSCRWTRK